MNWNTLDSEEALKKINDLSEHKKILLFKHSTRCSISSMVLDRLERNWVESETEAIVPYFLDLIAFRELSKFVAAQYAVEHESPQVLVISKGKCIYHVSHTDISYKELRMQF